MDTVCPCVKVDILIDVVAHLTLVFYEKHGGGLVVWWFSGLVV